MNQLSRIAMIFLGLLGSINLIACKHVSDNSTSALTAKPIPTQPYIQSIQRGDTLKIILATDGCFELDTYTIRASCKPELLNIVKVLNSYGNAPVTVAGYTDAVTNSHAAKILAKQQADSIVAYLWAHGNAYQRFHTIGYGKEHPIATNLNTTGSYYNRRVEITTRKS